MRLSLKAIIYIERNTQVGDSMRNNEDPLEMHSFRIPKGLMASVKSVCQQEGINISQFVRASLVLGLDLYFDQETGKEIINEEVE